MKSIYGKHDDRHDEAFVDYMDEEHVESGDYYEMGGFHPVHINDKLNNRYVVVNKLGWGGYATVWVALDQTEQTLVAIKINMASYLAGLRECQILQYLDAQDLADDSSPLFTTVIDHFTLYGPNGSHICIVMPLAKADLNAIRMAAGDLVFPIAVARVLCARLVQIVQVLHKANVVHGDIRLENILAPPSDPASDDIWHRSKVTKVRNLAKWKNHDLPAFQPEYLVANPSHSPRPLELSTHSAREIYLADFGLASQLGLDKPLGSAPLNARPPEEYFEGNGSTPMLASDIWSLAVAMWCILGTRCWFFGPRHRDNILEQMKILGVFDFPRHWKEQWNSEGNMFPEDIDDLDGEDPDSEDPDADDLDADDLDDDGLDADDLLADDPDGNNLYADFKHFISSVRLGGESFDRRERRAFVEMMEGMMEWDPSKRSTIGEVMACDWMKHWAMPELDKASV